MIALIIGVVVTILMIYLISEYPGESVEVFLYRALSFKGKGCLISLKWPRP